jgi:glycosyltransferase involved in cell wall biosynthesis
MGGSQTQIKGFDLLSEALTHLQDKKLNLELVIFGQSRPEKEPNLGFPLHYTGHISDEKVLQTIYSAVDAFVIPSCMDNLPNTGVESMSCGTPVIAFDTCGLKDIVIHKENGWLAKAFDTNDLAHGIEWTIEDKERHQKLCLNAREFSLKQFSYSIIAHQYEMVYKNTIEQR